MPVDINQDSPKSQIEIAIEHFAQSLIKVGFTEKGVRQILSKLTASSAYLTIAEIYQYMKPAEIEALEQFNAKNPREDIQIVELDRICKEKMGEGVERTQNKVMMNLMMQTIQEIQRLLKYGNKFANLNEEQIEKISQLISEKRTYELDGYLNSLNNLDTAK